MVSIVVPRRPWHWGALVLVLSVGHAPGSRAQKVAGNDSRGALRSAFEANDLAAMRVLLDQGADANQRDRQGHTILHAMTGEVDMRFGELLIAKGANVDAQDNQGDTPLHVAIGHRTLIDKPGCEESRSTEDGSRCWRLNLRFIRFLLSHKARPEVANRGRRWPRLIKPWAEMGR